MNTFISNSRNHLRTGLATALLALVSVAAVRAQVLDQEQLDDTGGALGIVGFDISANSFFFPNGQSVAQTFTVGITGKLTSMSIPLYKDSEFTENLTYYLLPVNSAGLPNSNNAAALKTGSLTPNQVVDFFAMPLGMDGWTPIVFSTPLAVTAGEKLTLELAASGTNDGDGPTIDAWADALADNPYAGGTGVLRGSTATVVPFGATWKPTDDFGFADFVVPAAVPEPRLAAVAAAAMALLALWQMRRRRTPSQ